MKERNIDRIVRGTTTMQMLGSIGWDLAGALLLWGTAGDGLEKLSTGRWWEPVVTGVFGLLFAWYGVSTFFENLRWRRYPEEHPAFKCPAYGTPEQVRRALQEALNTPRRVCVVDVEVTDEWLLTVSKWEVKAIYLPLAAWYFKRVTEHKKYWVTTDVTYDFLLHTTDGQEFSRDNISEAQVDRLLALVSERAPAAIGGYSEQIHDLWYKDREAFIKTVEERRAALEREARAHRRACAP